MKTALPQVVHIVDDAYFDNGYSRFFINKKWWSLFYVLLSYVADKMDT